jgi:hypothetical protein
MRYFSTFRKSPYAKVDTFEVEVIAFTLTYSTGTLNYLCDIFSLSRKPPKAEVYSSKVEVIALLLIFLTRS